MAEILVAVCGPNVIETCSRLSNGSFYRGKWIVVSVQTYNVRELIGEAFDGIPDHVARVSVANDGSTSIIGEIIGDYARLGLRFAPVHNNPSRGVEAAFTPWMKFAMGIHVLVKHGDISLLMFVFGMQFLFLALLLDMRTERSIVRVKMEWGCY